MNSPEMVSLSSKHPSVPQDCIQATPEVICSVSQNKIPIGFIPRGQGINNIRHTVNIMSVAQENNTLTPGDTWSTIVRKWDCIQIVLIG